jgi:hypothetical protein
MEAGLLLGFLGRNFGVHVVGDELDFEPGSFHMCDIEKKPMAGDSQNSM